MSHTHVCRTAGRASGAPPAATPLRVGQIRKQTRPGRKRDEAVLHLLELLLEQAVGVHHLRQSVRICIIHRQAAKAAPGPATSNQA